MQRTSSDFRYNTGETQVPWAAVGENYNQEDVMAIIRFLMRRSIIGLPIFLFTDFLMINSIIWPIVSWNLLLKCRQVDDVAIQGSGV